MPPVRDNAAERDFRRLVQGQFASSDFDAEHPVCRWLIDRKRLDDRTARWLSFLYMAFYDEASAWAVLRRSDPFTVPARVDYPIGRNRRNLFGGRVVTHLESLRRAERSAAAWPYHDFTGEPAADWGRLKTSLSAVWGNGRFGTYTTAEMLQKVNGAPVEIVDFDNDGSSSPLDGLRRLRHLPKDAPLTALDAAAEDVYRRVAAYPFAPTYTATDRGVVESVLCNYSCLCRGLFYSGRNVDRQQARIAAVEAGGEDLSDLWEARAACLNHCDLGEFHGRTGIDKVRLTHYARTGEVLWSREGR